MECKFESPHWISVKVGLSQHNSELTKGWLCEDFKACRKGIGEFSAELHKVRSKAPRPASLSAFALRGVATLQHSRDRSISHGAEVRLRNLSFSLTHSPAKKAYFSLLAFTLPSLRAILIYIRLPSGIDVLFFPQALILDMSSHYLLSNAIYSTYILVLWCSSHLSRFEQSSYLPSIHPWLHLSTLWATCVGFLEKGPFQLPAALVASASLR